ncbi:hypothetical protein TRICI_000431 [Trichomonascus ciferrii]|uniref:SHSP domain-containing protein n=1 Tax=Trichomonascus ciferrii TaxID=44093 RepID=A0A642VDE8_9ASCO|nr:hypothetical protein TRICI_000431 [Trichomonascus ciferrii]
MVYSSPLFYLFDSVESDTGYCKEAQQKKKESVKVSPRTEFYRYSSEVGVESTTSPAIDVYDTPENYIAVLSLAGATASDVNVDFDSEERALTISGVISGSKNLEQNDELKQYLKINERTLGKFERKVYVPSDPEIDEENIQAKINSGVLKITVPKVAKPVPEKRKITVTEEKEQAKDKESQPSDDDSVMVDKQ